MPRNNQSRRTRASTTVRITESDEPGTPKPVPALVDTTPEFIRHIRRHLLQVIADAPERTWSQLSTSISATTPQGLQVHGLTFNYLKEHNKWTIHCGSSGTSVSEETIELAWKKAFEHLTTRTNCTACDKVIRLGDPCVPCGIRQLVATKECCVCKDEKHNFYKLLCGHAFCKDCVKRTKPQRCPLCRAAFRVNDGLEERDSDCDYGSDEDE